MSPTTTPACFANRMARPSVCLSGVAASEGRVLLVRGDFGLDVANRELPSEPHAPRERPRLACRDDPQREPVPAGLHRPRHVKTARVPSRGEAVAADGQRPGAPEQASLRPCRTIDG